VALSATQWHLVPRSAT